ncbi:class A beta-lactamase-related serine hydrolase [Nocardioidaceae bacterium SCSIO 66511]|nr:class A beta-lactamase-related serine hydrolase [Nocardioidaceae bacterium SCSIO 66511]
MNSEAQSAYGYSGEAVQVAHEVRRMWDGVGLTGGFAARNLDTGEELGFDADVAYPLASVVKLPLALVTLDLIAKGELARDLCVELRPEDRTSGATGVSAYRHATTVALEDLIYSMLALSDNAAADAVFDLVPPKRVTAALSGWGCEGVVIRHPVRTLFDAIYAAAADERLALELAIRATTGGGGHELPALDVASASCGTARGLVLVLDLIWTDRVSVPEATERVRTLMARQLTSNRMAPALASDSVRVASKTGTFFNLRHDVGVVSTVGGDRIAIAALTASSVPALLQPEADGAIGDAARSAVDVLRL